MIAPLTMSPGPQPDANESYEHFIIRAHRELQQSHPDPMQRNELIWQAWEQARGPTVEQQIAARSFPMDRYTPLRNQCIFAEHEALDGQGQPRKYGLPEMVRVLRGCNHRIRDIDGFAPLTDGHTPSGDKGGKSPLIVGYAGPYRLGMIGRENPRWAVFCDEWHQNEAAGAVATKPRRSVELWTFKDDPTKLYFDPIAILGAETPRLPLPVRYQSLEVAGAQVERYSFESAGGAPVSPGGANTFVRGPVRQGPPKRKSRAIAAPVDYEFDESKIKRDNVGQFATKAGTAEAGGGLKTQRPGTPDEQLERLKKTPFGPGQVVDPKKPPPRFASRADAAPAGQPQQKPAPSHASTLAKVTATYTAAQLAAFAATQLSNPAVAGLALGGLIVRAHVDAAARRRAEAGKPSAGLETARAALTGATLGAGSGMIGAAARGALGGTGARLADAHLAKSGWPPMSPRTGVPLSEVGMAVGGVKHAAAASGCKPAKYDARQELNPEMSWA